MLPVLLLPPVQRRRADALMQGVPASQGWMSARATSFVLTVLVIVLVLKIESAMPIGAAITHAMTGVNSAGCTQVATAAGLIPLLMPWLVSISFVWIEDCCLGNPCKGVNIIEMFGAWLLGLALTYFATALTTNDTLGLVAFFLLLIGIGLVAVAYVCRRCCATT